MDMFIYTFPILSLSLPVPLALVDSQKLGFAYLLDFLLKFMAIGFAFLDVDIVEADIRKGYDDCSAGLANTVRYLVYRNGIEMKGRILAT